MRVEGIGRTERDERGGGKGFKRSNIQRESETVESKKRCLTHERKQRARVAERKIIGRENEEESGIKRD